MWMTCADITECCSVHDIGTSHDEFDGKQFCRGRTSNVVLCDDHRLACDCHLVDSTSTPADELMHSYLSTVYVKQAAVCRFQFYI